MIKLGDRITVKPATFDVPGKDGKPKGVPGTVVYIHPAISRMRSRRSYFRNTATYGNSPPLRTSTRRSRTRSNISRCIPP